MSAADTLREAVEALAERIDAYTAHDIGPAFTCAEADALTAVFTAAGCDDAAQRFADAHALGDEDGDAHYSAAERPAMAARLGLASDVSR